MKRTEIKQILHSELCASYCKKCHYDFYEDACKYCHKNQLLEWIMDVCGVQGSSEQKNPCDNCQEFDCYGCEYAERKEE